MRLVTLLDTAVSSDNLGDEIIMDSVRDELNECIPDAYFYTVATHDSLGRTARRILRQTEFCIVGGTNFLSSTMLRGSGWKVSLRDLGALKNVVMMGVGWRDYQDIPSRYARFIYDRTISKEHVHACRDEYSTGKLKALGRSAINTTCPTLWRMTPEQCAGVASHKADTVVTSLTSYRPDPEADRLILDLLRDRYARVLFWTQQAGDLPYLRALGDYEFEIIAPNVRAYSERLAGEQVDYVGSRLHGGIRALQNKRRALVVSVDNRATEIGRDTGLPVVERSDLDAIRHWIDAPGPTKICLPTAAIARWKAQFAAGAQ